MQRAAIGARPFVCVSPARPRRRGPKLVGGRSKNVCSVRLPVVTVLYKLLTRTSQFIVRATSLFPRRPSLRGSHPRRSRPPTSGPWGPRLLRYSHIHRIFRIPPQRNGVSFARCTDGGGIIPQERQMSHRHFPSRDNCVFPTSKLYSFVIKTRLSLGHLKSKLSTAADSPSRIVYICLSRCLGYMLG